MSATTFAPEHDLGFVPSIARNALARLAAEMAGLVLGTAGAVVTARWLGPSNKGVLSSLLFLSGLLMQICSLGLGDAAIVLIGQKRASPQQAMSASLGALVASSLAGMALLWLIAAIVFSENWNEVKAAVLVSCVGVPIGACSGLLSHMLNSRELVVWTSAVVIGVASVTTGGLWAFLVLMNMSVLGGVLAGVLASAGGVVILTRLVRRLRLRLSVVWSPQYLRGALRFGAVIQASYLLVMLSGRLDLLFVYTLSGRSAAGHYSVALTLGTVLTTAPFALSYASFPRLARLEEADAEAFALGVCRMGLAAALLLGACMLLLIPLLVPALFGEAYVAAVGPALILVPTGLLWSEQWLVCRAAAARGDPKLLLWSFGTSVGVMSVLDVVLIPAFGIAGAAMAAAVASAAGLALCLTRYLGDSLAELVPTRGDFAFVLTMPKRLIGVLLPASRNRGGRKS
jgi:O-antigen/teichoic acid export membrane protein